MDRLDDVIERFDLAAPDHIKLDVDGAELAVLGRRRGPLGDDRLKSLMVELDPSRGEAVVAALGASATARRALRAVDRPPGAPSYGLFARR